MERISILLLCIFAACTVRAVHGRNIEVSISDVEEMEMEMDTDVTVDARKLPGICWACKWALKKVKKVIGPNATAKSLTTKLSAVCNDIGLLKSLCRKFIKEHIGELIEELTTTDDVRTICVNTKACKPKELLDLVFDADDEVVPVIKVNGLPVHPMHG
ncbi:NK-lysin tandem duplicate 4 [Acanthochromis polyacanthus]|uniref:Antimicrobial peptide NK-lysin-like n=1 Tax=Acanthochromis polyacanthus TaxID=80966 RepID=A0A3Q1FY67_9TELE|nr:NK-lysin tandem duplicate 4 [Acanthochromis polyacanthus]